MKSKVEILKGELVEMRMLHVDLEGWPVPMKDILQLVGKRLAKYKGPEDRLMVNSFDGKSLTFYYEPPES